jgi:hypothetical protein
MVDDGREVETKRYWQSIVLLKKAGARVFGLRRRICIQGLMLDNRPCCGERPGEFDHGRPGGCG